VSELAGLRKSGLDDQVTMKLIDALKIVSKESRPDGKPLKVALVCGFTPLHLQTLLHAELQLHFPDRRVEIKTGLYGDIVGTLSGLRASQHVDAVALVVEWEDLDARLGIRRLGGWDPRNPGSVIEQARLYLSQLQALLEELCRAAPIAVCLPTLPLPPFFSAAGWQSGVWEMKLKEELVSFASALSGQPMVRFVSEQRLAFLSPHSERLNIKTELEADFPYNLSHASAVAGLLSRLIQNPAPKKGLITDLDDTLWRGIVGEVGAQGVHWDLDHHSQSHGLYQQLLMTLSEEGALVAVASKNDKSTVESVFEREDLLLPKRKIFPLEVGWGSKAEAVSRILKAWNVGADSVVFIDDSPLELAEVQSRHPQALCLLFPTDDPQAVYDLLASLRDLFGKSAISREDELRLESIRSNAAMREAAGETVDGFSEALLEQAEAELIFSLQKDAGGARALELINKTNQFNLNGRRITEAEWRSYLQDDETFLLTAHYKDRFGALGKIAAIAGRWNNSTVTVEFWVMSCRAFSRRIEHQSLKFLFEKFGCGRVIFDYAQTPRNGPLRSFFAALLKEPPTFGAAPGLEITGEQFAGACPKLFHHVVDLAYE
jgi:FkbH-like protein